VIFSAKFMQKITIDTESGKLELALIYDPFDEALEALEEVGEKKEEKYKIISLPQNAKLRAYCGENHLISRSGSRVREWVLYVPNGKNKLITIPLSLKSAREATQAHREKTEFYLTGNQLEQYLKDSIDFPDESIKIPTDRLDWENLTVHAFGGESEAQDYGDFLNNIGIKNLIIYAVDKDEVKKQPLPFVRPIWFRSLENESTLYSIWGLQYADTMFGIKNGSQLIQPLNKTRTRHHFSDQKLRADNF
jgi:hypothetical protein